MSRTRTLVVACALALTATVGVACGDGGGEFDDSVAQVRAAVASGDQAGADRALEELAIAALVAHQEGTLTDAELAEVADLIESSRAHLGEVITTPTAAPVDTSPATEPTPAEPPPAPPAVDDDGAKKGKGKDRGRDD
ncbi:MAG: hypothetical protein ACSLFO_14685 [Acidimicrobiales bacterium]